MIFFLVFSPFVRLNKIGRCFKQNLHQAVMTTTPHLNTRERHLKPGVQLCVHTFEPLIWNVTYELVSRYLFNYVVTNE